MSDPQGLRFEPVAEHYELGRAEWPPEVVDGVDGVVVLDLAAGTGKLTRLLVERIPEREYRDEIDTHVYEARRL